MTTDACNSTAAVHLPMHPELGTGHDGPPVSPGDDFLFGKLVAERQKIQLSLERRKRKEELVRKREQGFQTHINGANEERLLHRNKQIQMQHNRTRPNRAFGVVGQSALLGPASQSVAPHHPQSVITGASAAASSSSTARHFVPNFVASTTPQMNANSIIPQQQAKTATAPKSWKKETVELRAEDGRLIKLSPFGEQVSVDPETTQDGHYRSTSNSAHHVLHLPIVPDEEDYDEELGQESSPNEAKMSMSPTSGGRTQHEKAVSDDVVNVLTMLETAPTEALEKVRASLRLSRSNLPTIGGHQPQGAAGSVPSPTTVDKRAIAREEEDFGLDDLRRDSTRKPYYGGRAGADETDDEQVLMGNSFEFLPSTGAGCSARKGGIIQESSAVGAGQHANDQAEQTKDVEPKDTNFSAIAAAMAAENQAAMAQERKRSVHGEVTQSRLPVSASAAEALRPPSAVASRRTSVDVQVEPPEMNKVAVPVVSSTSRAGQKCLQTTEPRLPIDDRTAERFRPPSAVSSRPRSRMSQVHVEYTEIVSTSCDANTSSGSTVAVRTNAGDHYFPVPVVPVPSGDCQLTGGHPNDVNDEKQHAPGLSAGEHDCQETPRMRTWSTSSQQTDSLIQRIQELDEEKQRALEQLLDHWWDLPRIMQENNQEVVEQKWTWNRAGDDEMKPKDDQVVPHEQNGDDENSAEPPGSTEYGSCLSRVGGSKNAEPDAVVPIAADDGSYGREQNGSSGSGTIGPEDGANPGGRTHGGGVGANDEEKNDMAEEGEKLKTKNSDDEEDEPDSVGSKRRLQVKLAVLCNHSQSGYACELKGVKVYRTSSGGRCTSSDEKRKVCRVRPQTIQATGLTEGGKTLHRLFRRRTTSKTASTTLLSSWSGKTAAATGSFVLRFEADLPEATTSNGHTSTSDDSYCIALENSSSAILALCDADVSATIVTEQFSGATGGNLLTAEGDVLHARVRGIPAASGEQVYSLAVHQHIQPEVNKKSDHLVSSDPNSSDATVYETEQPVPMLIEGVSRATPATSARQQEDKLLDKEQQKKHRSNANTLSISAAAPSRSTTSSPVASNKKTQNRHQQSMLASFDALEKSASRKFFEPLRGAGGGDGNKRAAYDFGFDEIENEAENEEGTGNSMPTVDDHEALLYDPSFAANASNTGTNFSEGNPPLVVPDARPSRREQLQQGAGGALPAAALQRAGVPKSSASSSSEDEDFKHLRVEAEKCGEPGILPSPPNAMADYYLANDSAVAGSYYDGSAIDHNCVGASLLPPEYYTDTAPNSEAEVVESSPGVTSTAQNTTTAMNPRPAIPLVMPTLPRGKLLVFNCASTWGDPDFVGLAGIEIFDDKGELVVLPDVENQVSAEPDSVNVLHGPNSGQVLDPRTPDKLFDQVNLTRDDFHVWLAPFRCGKPHTVMVDLLEEKCVSMIRIWNYNKSRLHANRGCRIMEIFLDKTPIFVGEIRKASGDLNRPDQVCEHLLFCGEEQSEVLEKIEERDWLPRLAPEIGDPEFLLQGSSEEEEILDDDGNVVRRRRRSSTENYADDDSDIGNFFDEDESLLGDKLWKIEVPASSGTEGEFED
ncbi:unnamed protein product [Amoebophrya sp. A120]|nr:unnamed protein product [Amoebophrya sp. A120]|eukprot:GSA120T00004108001.1